MDEILYTVEGPLDAVRGLCGQPGIEVFCSPFLVVGDGRVRGSGLAADNDSLQSVLANQDLELIPGWDKATVQRQFRANQGKVGFDLEGNRLGWLTHDDVNGALQALVANSGGHAFLGSVPIAPSEGDALTPFYIGIGNGPADRMVVGGIHAREWAPVDALVSLSELIVDALRRRADLLLPPFFDYTGRFWPQVAIPFACLEQAFGRSSALIFPLVNPDGRNYSLSSLTGGPSDALLWRKNRRPVTDAFGDSDIGVDINRNFPVVWDADAYYQAGVAHASSPHAWSDVFRGPTFESEAETRNVTAILAAEPGISWYLDVHSYGPEAVFPWAMEGTQSHDSSQSAVTVPVLTHQSDGYGTAYSEWMPNSTSDPKGRLVERLNSTARRMARGVAAAGYGVPDHKPYHVRQSSFGYLHSGGSTDFACALGLVPFVRDSIVSVILECGSLEDGAFWPDFSRQFAKVEREVHGAVLAFLFAASAAPWP